MADVTNLAQVTEGGISCATFPEIKDALAQKMQEIYGYDIDLSTASADGQYVMMEALVLNNIYRTLESLVNNLSLASASGKYLDILSNLSGVFRRQATYSTANIYIQCSANITPQYLLFVDKNNNTWKWTNYTDADGNSIRFDKDKIYTINIVCEDLGPIEAIGGEKIASGESLQNIFATAELRQSGDIYECFTSGILTYQDKNAIIGQVVESDSELRARRFKSLGIGGSTSIDSLNAQLRDIPGILDCIVYNNSTAGNLTLGALPSGANDEVSIKEHSIYVVLVIDPNVNITNYEIGFCIYKNLPFGIKAQVNKTTGFKGGNIQSYSFEEGNIPYEHGGSDTSVNTNTIQWKSASLQTTIIKFSLELRGNPATSIKEMSQLQLDTISNAVISYMNNINFNESFQFIELQNVITNALINKNAQYKLIDTTEGSTKGLFLSQNSSNEWVVWDQEVYLPQTKFFYQKKDVTITKTDATTTTNTKYVFSIGTTKYKAWNQTTTT